MPATCPAPAAAGDEGALYRDFAVQLQRLVARRVNGVTRETVEDACAFAWSELLRHQPDRYAVHGWLATVAIREAIRLRAHHLGVLRLDCPWVPDSGHRQGSEATTLGDIVPAPQRDTVAAHEALRAIATLHVPRQRRIFELFVAGHSYQEISDQLGVTLRTWSGRSAGPDRLCVTLQPHRCLACLRGA